MRLLAAPMLWLSILLAVLLLAATTAYCGLRLADSISSTDPSVARNFLQVDIFEFIAWSPRFMLKPFT